MASSFVLWTSLSLFGLSAAQPAITFPFNSQLPPVARIAEPFSYTLSRQTFTSTSSITYSLNDAPSWLSIDNSTGRLFGTPKEDDVSKGDVVGVPVDVVATDNSGSATMTATLVVSRNKAPIVTNPLADQIQKFGDQSAPHAIVSYPATPFSFSFANDTFSAQTSLDYYATSADSSPLPSWMKFDPATLTFSGQTPPFETLVQPPQTFDFHLVASDVVGFAGVSILFSVVVGSRKLTADSTVIQLNATPGDAISYTRLQDDIKLDGGKVDRSEVTVSTRDLPGWLTFNETSLILQGTPAENDQSTNATITFQTALSDTLNIRLAVFIASGIFRKNLSDIEIQSDKPFSLDLEPYLQTPDDTTVEIETTPSQDWLRTDGLLVSGTPPSSSEIDEDIRLSIKATLKRSGDSETKNIQLSVLASGKKPSPTRTSAPSSTETQTQSPKKTGEAGSVNSFGSGMSAGQIMLAVLIPIFVIAALVLLFFCLRKRRERKFRRIETKNISGPIPGSFTQNDSLHSNRPSMAEPAKAYDVIPPPEPTYRPGQSGYIRAALQRLRSTRSASSFGSDSHSDVSLVLPTLPGLRSLSDNAISESRWSWLTEEGYLGRLSRGGPSQRQSRNSFLSLYESICNFPSGPRFLHAQDGNSFRSTLDVTIPSMADDEFDRKSIQPTPEVAYMFEKTGHSKRSETATGSNLLPVPLLPAAASDALSAIPEQMSPLGSHPTHGKRFTGTNPAGTFKVHSDSDAQSSSFQTVSGSSEERSDGVSLFRQTSMQSDLSRARPVSRRSDASPWFGSRAGVPPRTPRRRRTVTYSSSASVPTSTTGSSDAEVNWSRIAPGTSAARGTENWQLAPRDSLGIAYEELVRESPFYPTQTPPRRPLKSAQRSVGSSNLLFQDENRRHSAWMGKGVSLRRDKVRESQSTISLMSPSKWDTGARVPLGNQPGSSIRPVKPSAVWLGESGEPSRYSTSKPGSGDSGWETEAGTPMGRDDSSTIGVTARDDGRKGGLGRTESDDFAVFI
ncbi:hypothetical protein BN1723_014932 [Verticillium longisporum]|uniref:Dystroglycan-type cadherin-like domain-containing protein n=1 Tax=Verticillium longisporum TaxID=100787 RepID=A0A0G4MKY6_VERLO|nr:hypothetical protein BN1723_014932 [Verticillium longisporum]